MATELDPKDYEETPEGQAQRWQAELAAAKERLKDWHKQADECVARYLDEREGEDTAEKRLNLYTSGIQTKLSMLYGNVPDVRVERRFGDAIDDDARVAAEAMERILNADLERTGDNYQTAQKLAGWDHLVPGLGQVRLRYAVEMEKVPAQEAITDPVTGQVIAEAVPETEKKAWEDVETDWVHHKDFLFNPARVPHEIRWMAQRVQMSREQRDERFAHLGEEVLATIPTKSSRPRDDGDKKEDPLAVTEVWEIWSKRDKKVFFYVEGFPRVLDVKDDPLGLEDFFPFPEVMVANASTSKLVPRPDWVLYQDQYREIDALTTRISLLREAIRVVGVYDKSTPELKQLLEKAGVNKLYPAEQWNSFVEKGGLAGAFQLLPLEPIVGAITSLRENRAELIQDLFQVTGMSDIMRGQASSVGVTATEQAIKARFGSVRMQALQDRVAKFATDTQRIRAEIIAKHFDPQTILDRSNLLRSYDAALAQKAVQLLKSDFSGFRVAVKSESMSLTDFAAMKQERMEVLQGISAYMQVAAGIAQQMPGSVPGLIKILQHSVAGLKGADGLESILDEMVTQAQQQSQQPKPQAPDPKLQVEQIKGMNEQQKIQSETQSKLLLQNAEVQADAAREENQMKFNVMEHAQKQRITAALRPVQMQQAPKPRGIP